MSTSLPNWIADVESFAEKRGIEVEFKRFANSDLLLLALVNREIDATSVCADEPILAAAARGALGAEIYLQEVLTSDRLFEAILVRADSPMQSLSDLRGKTIACFPGSQLREYLKIILDRAGIEPGSVNIQQLPPPNMLPALESRTVDALFALEPTITIGVERGLARVLEPSPIVTYIGDGEPIAAASFVISTAWADANPEAADAFVRSVYDAVSLIESDYERCRSRYPEFTAIPAELASKVVITHFATVDDPDLDGLRTEERILRDAGVLEVPVDVETLIYRWRAK